MEENLVDYVTEERNGSRFWNDGTKVETSIAEFTSCNIIEVEVGTNCPQGGDSGHGGKTYFRIEDLGSTDMSCIVTGQSCGNAGCIEITFGGDCECDTFIEALEWAVKKLKEQRNPILTKEEPVSPKEQKKILFNEYLNDLAIHYRTNNSLKGMSQIGAKYPVQVITREQFYECGLNIAAKEGVVLWRAFTDAVYAYIKDREKTTEAPCYVDYKNQK